MTNQIFMAYWLGYQQGGPPLEETPDGVSHVALAFAVTAPTSAGDGLTLDFLTSKHNEAEIRAGAKALQARGIKVVMSINGNPNWPGHPGGWANLNAPVFAANVKALVMDDWGLDGVDLDNEDPGTTPGEDFVAVVRALRTALGPEALLSLPVYLGTNRDAYLSQVRDEISFVATMAYWLPFEDQTSMFTDYAALVGADKVVIGVSDASGGQSTDFAEVPQLAAWNPQGAAKAGIMLWDLNGVDPGTTASWCQAIVANLPQAAARPADARIRHAGMPQG
jgi:chitinase